MRNIALAFPLFLTLPVEGQNVRVNVQENQGNEELSRNATSNHRSLYSGSSATYTYPFVDGPGEPYCNDRLDWCICWGGPCGIEAAHEFCRQQGHDSAISILKDIDIQSTRLIGDGKICKHSSTQRCDGFKEITCRERRPANNNPKTFWYPKLLDGMPLDYCYSLGKWCGGRAADSFCRMNHYDAAKSYEIILSSAKTKTMVGGRVCDPAKYNCHTFRKIVCEVHVCII